MSEFNLGIFAKELYRDQPIPRGFWIACAHLRWPERRKLEKHLSDRAWCDSITAVDDLAGSIVRTEAYVKAFLDD